VAFLANTKSVYTNISSTLSITRTNR